jgi:hypothetical protein
LTQSYPWYTPYQFAGNKPIIAIDIDGLEDKIIVSQINNGKQEKPLRVLTEKDLEFKAILNQLPKELKGVKPGVGTLQYNQFRFSGVMHWGDPNYNEYLYYRNESDTKPSATATLYTNPIARWMMESSYSPQNITLESIGVKAVGVGYDASFSVGMKGEGVNGKIKGSNSGSIQVTNSTRIIDNGSYNNLLNNSTSVTGLVSSDASLNVNKINSSQIQLSKKNEHFAYFSFSNKLEPPQIGAASSNVLTIKIEALKISFSQTKSGNFDLKIGITSNPGFQYTNGSSERMTLNSETTKIKF